MAADLVAKLVERDMFIVPARNKDGLLPQRVKSRDRARGAGCNGIVAVGNAMQRPDHFEPVRNAAEALRHSAAGIVRDDAVGGGKRRHIVFNVM